MGGYIAIQNLNSTEATSPNVMLLYVCPSNFINKFVQKPNNMKAYNSKTCHTSQFQSNSSREMEEIVNSKISEWEAS